MTNKRILTLITLLLFLLLLVGCKAINQAPIITSIPITAVELGETYTYDVNATDPEGDTLTYSLITKPAGMTITSTTGLIKWTPKAEGNFAVAVKVSDGVLYIIQSFTITVSKPPAPPPIVNYAPIITSIPGDTAIIGVVYLYDVNATDPEGDVLTYSLTKKPDDMTINSTTGLISWTPKQIGANAVIVKVSDGKKATTQSFTITVKAVELIGIEVKPNEVTLVAEDTLQLEITAFYDDGNHGVITTDCIYVSSNSSIVIVNTYNGLVTAICPGTVDITISYTPNGLVFTDTAEVAVIDLVHNTDTDKYYHTIQAAIDDGPTLDGHTIEVAAGTYNEQVVISKQLTLNGTNANESIIDGDETTAVTISANDVTVDGFTLDGGITLDDQENAISGGTISNNIITGADNPEETPPKAANGIRLGWDDGIGVDYITIENNIIKNSLCKGIRFASPKAKVVTPTPGNSYITIRNNEIKDNGSAGMETYGPGPNFITDNTISGNFGNGINLKFDDGDIVTGNIITNNTGPGITLRQVINSIVENNSISIHQSSVAIKSWPDVIGGKGSGIHIMMVSKGNTIRYNDISSNNYGIFIHSKDDSLTLQPSDNSINFNNIYSNNTYGILNALVDPPKPVDAEDNWWGIGGTDESAGKPDEDGNNNVSANVDYEPWSTSEF